MSNYFHSYHLKCTVSLKLRQWLSKRGDFSPANTALWGYLVIMSWYYYHLMQVLLASRGSRPRVLLNTLQYVKEFSTTRNYPVQNTTCDKVEEPWLKDGVWGPHVSPRRVCFEQYITHQQTFFFMVLKGGREETQIKWSEHLITSNKQTMKIYHLSHDSP